MRHWLHDSNNRHWMLYVQGTGFFTRRLIKVIKIKILGLHFNICIDKSRLDFMFMSQAYWIALFVCHITVEIRMFSTNKTFCNHYDADSDNAMSTVTRRLLGTKLVSGTTVGDVIIEMAKDVSFAREKPHKKTYQASFEALNAKTWLWMCE